MTRFRKILAGLTLSAATLFGVQPPSDEQIADAGKVVVLSAEPDRCGLTKLWATPAEDPFTPCCAVHDTEYLMPNARPRLAVDLQFFSCCVETAGHDMSERARALFFYKVVRLVGWPFYEGPR